MPEIRLLNEDDKSLLESAFHWSDDAPLWFKQHQEDESLEDFLNIADKLVYGIFDDGLTAVIRLNPFNNKVFSIDLFAKRTMDWNVLLEAGKSMKEYLYDREISNGFFGWIPDRNRPIVKLYQALGFVHNGIACYRGRYHNRPTKWLLMVSEKKH